MKLCFGVYVNVLHECKQAGVEKLELLNAVVQSVDKECVLTSNAVTSLFYCRSNLPDGKDRENSLGNVKSKAREASPAKVTEHFTKKVVPLIDSSKWKLAVLVLCDIIKNDESITDDTNVELISGVTKQALRVQSQFSLSDFLAGIFLYTIPVNNRVGKDAVSFLTEKYIQSFTRKLATINFTSTQYISGGEISVDALNAYFKFAKGKYGIVKTILNKNQYKPLYDFYVPNDVERGSGRNTGNTITKVTAKKLTDISNYLIINGVGGLGKTLMLQHLLLTAIEDYNDLDYIPIFIPLKDYGITGTVFDFIYSIIEVPHKFIEKAAFEDALKEGSFLLLFDGLDEINEQHSQRFEREFRTFTDKYPENRYVITSRPFQEFISYTRFTVIKIKPFTQEQAIQFIEKIDYRADDTWVKKGFLAQLKSESIFDTHRSFIENPLLLTIMIMIYEKSADIPTQMHVFYRKAFFALFEEHDSNKGGYKRKFQSGLRIDPFMDYFAEFCFRSYGELKFDFTVEEFTNYFNALTVNKGRTVTASAFADDLRVNLCLLLLEGHKYYFIHRSFQEYFCAFFFSKQIDVFQYHLRDFFEKRQKQMRGDNVLKMLYDMMPNKVEKYIFIPFLQDLFDKCDKTDRYWTFLEMMYPHIRFEVGDVDGYFPYTSTSYLFDFIIGILEPKHSFHCDGLPEEKPLVVQEFAYVSDGECCELLDTKKIPAEYPGMIGEPEIVGARYEFDVKFIRSRGNGYTDLLSALDDDGFVFKSEYNAAREFLCQMIEKQAIVFDDLLALI